MMALALSHLLSVMKLIALLLALSWCSGVVLAQECKCATDASSILVISNFQRVKKRMT